MNLRRRESKRERSDCNNKYKAKYTNVALHTIFHSASTMSEKKTMYKENKLCCWKVFVFFRAIFIHSFYVGCIRQFTFLRFSAFLQRILLHSSVKFARKEKKKPNSIERKIQSDMRRWVKKEGKFIFGRLGAWCMFGA